MTTAKTLDIHDYDFLYEDEIDVLEAETLQEAEPGYTGAHNVASRKQKSEGSVRQAMTDTARKAKEKGSKLWKSTENVRENTARTAKEKSTQLWNSTAGARKQAKQIWNNSTQRIKEVSSSPDARTLTELEDRTRSFFLVCGATAALWLMQMILSFIPTIHMRVMDLIGSDLVREWNLLTEHIVGNGRRTRNRCSDYYPDRNGNSEPVECAITDAADKAEQS